MGYATAIASKLTSSALYHTSVGRLPPSESRNSVMPQSSLAKLSINGCDGPLGRILDLVDGNGAYSDKKVPGR